MTQEVYLRVTGLTKRYRDILAVDGIDFSVCRGEVFGLLGPNGAGKTTTIRMLCGLLKADGGEITCNGIPLSTGYARIKPLIGLCPQEIVLWGLLTCLEQLKFVGQSYGLSPREAGRRSEELLLALGLSEKRHKLGKTLSGGMQRRMNIALALVHDPQLVILDEPQAGLDPQSRILVRDYIRQLAHRKTVILTTHDMDEADRLSDRIAIIDHGKVLMIDTPQGLKESSGVGDVLQIRLPEEHASQAKAMLDAMPPDIRDKKVSDGFLLLGAEDLLSQITAVRRVLQRFQMEAMDMTVRKRTLEDAFIAMTGRGLRE